MNPPQTDTFNDRVRKFWEWFQEVAPSYHAAIDAGECRSLTEPTCEVVNGLFPHLSWTYGPVVGGTGHSFTLTGEGIEHHQLLAIHWLSQAPPIKGWTFYADRQAGPIKGHRIRMGDVSIDPKEIWVTPSINEDRKCVDLTIWHPLWPQLEKSQLWTIVFLFLDEALGEYGTQLWTGGIRLENDRLTDSFPLEELPDFIQEVVMKEGWKKALPGEGYTLFEVTPSDESSPRSDLLTLTTATPNFFHDYWEANGKMEDLFGGLGADYLYVSIRRDFLPAGEEVDKRYELECALDTALKSHASGRCIGGGLGRERAYVDLLIFDGQRSLDIIVETTRDLNLPQGTTIEYFAVEKADNRIRL